MSLTEMENKYFPLEAKENSRLVRIVQLVLGVLCIAIAIFWIVYNVKSLRSDNKLWASIAFLVLFGFYEILAGTGKTTRYIKTGPGMILLKQHSVLPRIELISDDIEKIEVYPLSIKFHLKNSKKILLRFGLSFTEIIEPVKNEIIEFAWTNKIPAEVITEEF